MRLLLLKCVIAANNFPYGRTPGPVRVPLPSEWAGGTDDALVLLLVDINTALSACPNETRGSGINRGKPRGRCEAQRQNFFGKDPQQLYERAHVPEHVCHMCSCWPGPPACMPAPLRMHGGPPGWLTLFKARL